MASGGGGGGSGGSGGSDPHSILQGGNQFGQDVAIGSKDAFSLIFKVDNVNSWKINEATKDLSPMSDDAYGVGTPHDRVSVVYATAFEVLLHQDDPQPVVLVDSSGVHFGADGDVPVDILVRRGVTGGGAPELFADTPSGTYQLTPTESSLWVDSGGVIEQVNQTLPIRIGGDTAIPDLETGYTNQWLFTGDFEGLANGNLAMILRNTNVGPVAYSTIMACNDQGVGTSLTSVSSGWVDPGIGFVAGDSGIVSQTCRDIDPAGDAGMVLASGILPIKGIMNFAERWRFNKNDYAFLWGTKTNSDPNHYLADFVKDQNDYEFIAIENPHNGTNANAGFACQAGGKYGLMVQTCPSYSIADNRGAETLVLEAMNGSGGINIMTDISAPVVIKTNGTTRLQIDGDGNIGVFGHATQAQPTVTGSRGGNAALASLLSALAGFGWIVDGTSA